MSKAVMGAAAVSLDGFIADDEDKVGPLFDWNGNGDVGGPGDLRLRPPLLRHRRPSRAVGAGGSDHDRARRPGHPPGLRRQPLRPVVPGSCSRFAGEGQGAALGDSYRDTNVFSRPRGGVRRRSLADQIVANRVATWQSVEVRAWDAPMLLLRRAHPTGRLPVLDPLRARHRGDRSGPAVGDEVEGFRAGEPVAALLNDFGRTQRVGGYAEVAIAHASMARAVRETTDLRRLTAVLSNGVAGWIALHKLARIRENDRVLVLGAGRGAGGDGRAPRGVSSRRAGHRRRRSRSEPRTSECTAVIEAAELEQRLDELTADGQVDVVVDPVGGPQRGRVTSTPGAVRPSSGARQRQR